MIHDFNKDKNMVFDGSVNHQYLLNEYVKNNHKKYIEYYQKQLQEVFDVDIKFIKVNQQNIILGD